MALSYDSSASATAVGDTVLFNTTVAQAGSIMLFFNSNTVGYALYNLATVRYPTSGTDATFVGQVSSGNRSIGCWYLVNPTTGTNQVEMAFSSNFDKCGAVAVYNLAKQTGQPDSSNSDSGNPESTYSLSTTVVLDDCWTVAGWVAPSGATPSSGTTERIDQADGGAGSHLYVGDSNGPVSAGSRSLEYTGSDSEWDGIIVSIAPLSTGGVKVRIF